MTMMSFGAIGVLTERNPSGPQKRMIALPLMPIALLSLHEQRAPAALGSTTGPTTRREEKPPDLPHTAVKRRRGTAPSGLMMHIGLLMSRRSGTATIGKRLARRRRVASTNGAILKNEMLNTATVGQFTLQSEMMTCGRATLMKKVVLSTATVGMTMQSEMLIAVMATFMTTVTFGITVMCEMVIVAVVLMMVTAMTCGDHTHPTALREHRL
jgi:hypothetical protein